MSGPNHSRVSFRRTEILDDRVDRIESQIKLLLYSVILLYAALIGVSVYASY